jgi:hypothetical protein
LSDLNGTAENGLGRILIPFQIAGIQQIAHIDPAIVTNPTAKSGPRTGLGDTQLYNFTLGSFDVGLPHKVTFGFGPLLVIPTRTDSNFGTGKLQAGASGVILAPQSWGLLSVLVVSTRYRDQPPRRPLSSHRFIITWCTAMTFARPPS